MNSLSLEFHFLVDTAENNGTATVNLQSLYSENSNDSIATKDMVFEPFMNEI